jgi:outer membrane protein assembly factor BamD (BamD/ComL family)
VAAKSGSQSPAADTAAYQHYQAAVQLVQQGKFDKALAAFEKLLPTAPFEIAERCRMYVQTCQRQINKHGLAFITPEERYDYAVSQLNGGYFEEAGEQLRGIIADYPRADYAFYGLALLDSITGASRGALTISPRLSNSIRRIGCRHAPITISRIWLTTRGSQSCCILKYHKEICDFCAVVKNR